MPMSAQGHDRFRLAVDASPAAMIMVNASGGIEFANAETERMFGYAGFELIGQSIDILVPARWRADHAGMRKGFFTDPSSRPMGAGRDLYAARKDGREFPAEIALTPIEANPGPMALATLVDITARRRTEQELARHAADLEIANERLNQFAYVASHDLQEPLRKIAVYADLLEKAIEHSERNDMARAASVIRSSAVRARRMVQNILTFSQVTGSETPFEPLDLRTEVDLALGDLSASIEETGALIGVDIPSVIVHADRAQLGRLIQNIVSNAIKYHKPGAAPAIQIKASRIGDARATLSIADDGIGFDESLAGQIFKPFKRLHDIAEHSGTGIGLAICKAIADRYGWALGVRSRPGEGATFAVTLPMA